MPARAHPARCIGHFPPRYFTASPAAKQARRHRRRGGAAVFL